MRKRKAVNQPVRGQKVQKPPKDTSKGKILFVGLLFAFVLMGLWARAYHVQIVKGPQYAKMANRQYWTSEIIAGKRGEIFDRNGLLLAKTVVTQSVFARPQEIRDPWAVGVRLGQILRCKPQKIFKLLNRKRRFVWIDRKISDAQAEAIRAEKLPGVYLDAESSRQYPQGTMAGQLLGFVNVDGKGIEGIERSFNKLLTASSAKFRVQRDAAGNRLSISGKDDHAAFDGQDVFLTLSSQVQMALEEALERSVQKSRSRQGMGLVVEIQTGDILAWGNYPFFNPNAAKKTRGEWKNRVAVDIFEPGSTMKAFLVAAALQEKICTPQTVFDCENGRWKVDGQRVKDTHKYKNLTVSEIIRYSSNIGAAKIGLSLGAQKYQEYLQAVGFSRPVGLPLPGESSGLLRPAAQWTQVDLANIAFGQGLGVTMLQLAEAYLCLANNGVRIPLRLAHQPEVPVLGRKIFDPEVAHAVMGMLESVVQDDGTGTRARIEGVRVAGKTGTAQKASTEGGYGSDYVASFVGIFPADTPKYLVLMMVDEPQGGHYGGVIVAPEVRNVGMRLLTASGMLAEPLRAAKNTRKVDRMVARVRKGAALGDGVHMPDFRGATARQALEVLIARGIVPVFNGQGVLVRKQDPPPGAQWPKNKQCQLWLTQEHG